MGPRGCPRFANKAKGEHRFSWRRSAVSGAGGRFFLREAFTAEDGTALRGAKGDGRLFAALTAGRPGFNARIVLPLANTGNSGEHGRALGLAGFAALGRVLELFVVEEKLFAGGKNKFRTAIDAGQYLVLKIH